MNPSSSRSSWNPRSIALNLSWLCADFTPVERKRTDDTAETLNPTSTCRCSYSLFKQIGLPLLLGQLLAAFIAVTAICSALLVQHNVSLPLTQNLFHYCFLTLCFVTALSVRSVRRACSSPPRRSNSHAPRWNRARCARIAFYILAGLVDTHANWAIVAAYAYTSVTSVQLLDCLSIPAAMLLSFLFLRYRFTCTHYIAMIICLLGAGGMVATDVLANPVGNGTHGLLTNTVDGNQTESGTSRIVLGDFLVILGALAYAGSNVLQQYLVMRYGIVEFLAYAGLAATVPTAVYVIVFERDGLYHLFTNTIHTASATVVFSCLAGYVASMFLLYALMPYVLSKTSAVLVNMSLLTADVYALIMGIYVFHNRFHVLYILCFVAILVGVGLFSVRSPTIRTEPVLPCCACLRPRSDGTRSEHDIRNTIPRPVCVYASGEQNSPSLTEHSLVT